MYAHIPRTCTQIIDREICAHAKAMVVERQELGEDILGRDKDTEDNGEPAPMMEDDAETQRKAYLKAYADYFKNEMEVVEFLTKSCYSKLGERSRWRALRWLCDTVAEQEEGAIRYTFRTHVKIYIYIYIYIYI
jgi:hypothetical protein